MWTLDNLPADYRYASDLEASGHEGLKDVIRVRVRFAVETFINDKGKIDARSIPVYHYAVPAAFPVYFYREHNCIDEFGEHTDHRDCDIIFGQMDGYGERDYDPMDYIPYGTPDEWIPDNPDDNGMRMSDFI